LALPLPRFYVGWQFLVDGLGWRWIFFVNIPFGIVAVAMSVMFLPKDKDQSKTQSQAVDWLGIGFLMIAVDCMQTLLEEGETDDWFSSSFMTTLAIASIIGLGLFIFIWYEVNYPNLPCRISSNEFVVST
jgi:MFS transporter, DHA2 family, multidrug resistance protein